MAIILKLFAEKCSVVRSHSVRKICVAAELSLSLRRLDAELMTTVGVVELYKTALSGRESLGCSLMSLYFCHFSFLLLLFANCMPPGHRAAVALLPMCCQPV